MYRGDMATDLLEPHATFTFNTTERLTSEDRRGIYSLILKLLSTTPLSGTEAELAKKVTDANP